MMDDTRIVVRDRRSVHQFSIHNRVVDEWFPIITARGFALYSLYCRMASKEEERCYPGYRLIAKHMGMGISTISDYNKLLVWCGLLHIEPGDRNSPNDYYILDIPEVTEDVLARIQKLAEEDVARLEQEREAEALKLDAVGMKKEATALRQKKVGTFYSGLLKRLDKWEPIYVHWGEEKERPFVIKSGQLSLFPGDPVGEYPDPVGEGGDPGSGSEQSTTTIQSNNPKQQQQHGNLHKILLLFLLLLMLSLPIGRFRRRFWTGWGLTAVYSPKSKARSPMCCCWHGRGG